MALSDIDKSPLYIDSTNSRVGIGTSSPAYNLDVYNSASTGAPLLARFKSAGGDTQLYVDNSTITTQLTADSFSNSGIVGTLTNHPFVFRTNNIERMRIDNSGNLLVGGTNLYPADNNIVGHSLTAVGQLQSSVSGYAPFIGNRKSSDGDIAVFKKDGTKVGSIGNNTDFYIASSDGTGLRFTNNQILPSDESGNLQNTSRDLGAPGSQFRDLYLSSGITFGATGGAVTSKTLDDYEEGTWTPVSGSITLGSSLGKYTKVGNMVFIIWQIQFPSNSNGNSAIVSGLPFNVGSGQYSGTTSITNFVSTNILPMVNHSDNTITFRNYSNGTYTNANMSSKFHYGWAVYTT
jgi:hypothetical protein